jgi:hypothetical protein
MEMGYYINIRHFTLCYSYFLRHLCLCYSTLPETVVTKINPKVRFVIAFSLGSLMLLTWSSAYELLKKLKEYP